jgi:hypothetical protein
LPDEEQSHDDISQDSTENTDKESVLTLNGDDKNLIRFARLNTKKE